MGKQWKQWQFSWAPKSLSAMIAVMKLKDNKLSLLFMTNLGTVVKSRDHLADKDPCSWRCGFPSSHVQMWELGHKEDWALKNWCFWIVVLEKTLESPLDSKEIKPDHLLEGLLLKLKLHYFGRLMRRATHWKRPWCWEISKVKGEGVTVEEMVR